MNGLLPRLCLVEFEISFVRPARPVATVARILDAQPWATASDDAHAITSKQLIDFRGCAGVIRRRVNAKIIVTMWV